jgi:hypothetical protein
MPIAMECPTVTHQEGRKKNDRLVQDLRAVNNAIITLHPVVPSPYTLLGLLPLQAS